VWLKGGIKVKLLHCRKSSSAIVLGTPTPLLIAEMLASVGRKETLGVGIRTIREKLSHLSSTYQRAQHSHSFASSLTGCPALERAPRVLRDPVSDH
jgi:hypothetical protein